MAPEGRNALIRNVERSARQHVYALMWQKMQDRTASKMYLPGVVRDLMNDLTSNVQHHLPGHGHDHGDKHSSDVEEGHGGDQAPRGLLSSLFHEHCDAPDPDKLFETFEEWKSRMLVAQGAHGRIARFKFGAQLQEMKEIFKKITIDTKQLKIVREVFLEAIRANYWEQLEHGRFVVGSPEPTLLLNSVNLAKESCGAHLSDWDILQPDIAFEVKGDGTSDAPEERRSRLSRLNRAATAVAVDVTASSGSMLSAEGLSAWANNRRIETNLKNQTTAIQVITAFMEAHQVAQGQIASYFGDGADIDSPEEAFVIMESQIEVYKASAMAGSIARTVHLRVNTMWEAKCLAEEYRKFVHAVADSGVLQNKEAEALLHPIADTLRSWEKQRRQVFHSLRDNGSSDTTITLSEVEAALLIQIKWRKLRKGGSRRSSRAPSKEHSRAPSKEHPEAAQSTELGPSLPTNPVFSLIPQEFEQREEQQPVIHHAMIGNETVSPILVDETSGKGKCSPEGCISLL